SPGPATTRWTNWSITKARCPAPESTKPPRRAATPRRTHSRPAPAAWRCSRKPAGQLVPQAFSLAIMAFVDLRSFPGGGGGPPSQAVVEGFPLSIADTPPSGAARLPPPRRGPETPHKPKLRPAARPSGAPGGNIPVGVPGANAERRTARSEAQAHAHAMHPPAHAV